MGNGNGNGMVSPSPPMNNNLNQLQNMGLSPMNQINVNQVLNNLPAITPTSKMNGFSFNNPANQQPVYLPPLATTPRFAVTPRGTTPRFNMNNNVTMNSAPLQIPTPLLKNTSGSQKKEDNHKEKGNNHNQKKEENNAKMTTLDEKNALNV